MDKDVMESGERPATLKKSENQELLRMRVFTVSLKHKDLWSRNGGPGEKSKP